MREKAIIFTNKKDFFEKEGFLVFSKPVFKFEYNYPILKINNKTFKTKRPLKFLEKLVKKYKLFATGFVSYDYKRLTLDTKSLKRKELPIPEIYFLLFKDYKILEKINPLKYKTSIKKVIFPEKKHFTKIVKKALKYIENGDIYQINLSDRLEIEGSFNKEDIFYTLTSIQPTEFMFFFNDINFSIISASMELFLKKNVTH